MNRLTEGVLIVALCLSSTAFAENFILDNKTDDTIHGACGSGTIYSVREGKDREFSCPDNNLRVYSSDARRYTTTSAKNDCEETVITARGRATNPTIAITCKDFIFILNNRTDDDIYGSCGSEKIHGIRRGRYKEFSCSDNKLRVYNSDASRYTTTSFQNACKETVVTAEDRATNPRLVVTCDE